MVECSNEETPCPRNEMKMDGPEVRLAGWLDEALGTGHGRRVVAVREDRVLVSKVPPGLPARVIDAIAGLPDLFDPAALRQRMPPGQEPAEAWRAAAAAVLREALEGGRLDEATSAEIQAGIDSVSALLAASFWTVPGMSAGWPSKAERAALEEAEARLARGSRGLFSRVYGIWEGKPVENHCPGAEVARALFAAARGALEGEYGSAPALAPEPGGPYDE